MADETTILTLDIGGDSADAQAAIDSVGSSLEGLNSSAGAATGDIQGVSGEADTASGSFDGLGAAVQGVGSQLAGLGPDIAGLSGTFSGISDGVGSLTDNLGPVGLVGAVGAAVGVFGGLGEAAVGWSDQLRGLTNLLGGNQTAAEQWTIAFEDQGVSASTVTRVFATLEAQLPNTFAAMQAGHAPAGRMKVLIDDLGVSIDDGNGHLRDMNSIMFDAMNALSNIQDPALRAEDAIALFGARGRDLLPIINDFSGNMAEATRQAEAHKMGIDDVNQFSKQYHTTMTDLNLEFEVLATRVGPPFLQFLLGVVTVITHLVDWTTDVVNAIIWWNQTVPINQTILEGLIGTIQLVIAAVQGIVTGVEALITFFANNVIPFFSTTVPDAFSGMVSTITGAISGFKDTITGTFTDMVSTVEGIVTGLPGAIKAGFQSVVDGVTGIVSGFKDWLVAHWQAIVTDALSILFPPYGVLQLVSHFTDIKNGIAGVITAIETALSTAWTTIASSALVAVSGVYTIITGGWQSISDFITGAWSWITGVVQNGLQTVATDASNAMLALPGVIQGGWDIVTGVFTGALSAIGDIVQYALGGIANFFGNLPTNILVALGDIDQIGVNIVRGIWDGIASLQDWLFGKVTDFAGNIFSSIKDGLGALWPFSPSKAGVAVGEGLGLGIIHGIERQMASVSGSAARLYGAISGSATVSGGGVFAGAGAAIGAASVAGGARSTTIVNLSVALNHSGPLMADQIEAQQFAHQIGQLIRQQAGNTYYGT